MNYQATCIYDDMTVIIKNDIEVSKVYQDNRTEYTKECLKLEAENEALCKADLTQKSLCKAELTDDEIDEVALNNMEGVGRLVYMVQGNVKGGDFKEAVRSFAKAILRKANEK